MKQFSRIVSIIFGGLLISMSSAAAGNGNEAKRERAGAFLRQAMSEAPMHRAVAGIFAVTAGGDTIACINPRTLLIPASNLKLVTTGLALHSLGPDYRWKTSVAHDGEIRNGVLHGNLHIVGGGDPTTGSRDSIAVPLETVFRQWKDIIAKAGIRKIEGQTIGDGRCFTGMSVNGAWQYDDLGTYYGTGVSGLSFFENKQNVRVSAGEKPGSPLTITPVYPSLPWMEYGYECFTGKPGTGNSLYLYTTEFAPAGVFRGSFAIDRRPKTEEVANKFPAYTCAKYFMDHLAAAGIPCRGGAAGTDGYFGTPSSALSPADSLRTLGSTFSPALRKVVFETNHDSNNFYSETLLRTLGMEYCGDGCQDSSLVAVYRLLDEIGVNTDGVQFKDGSGLSRQNYVSAGFFCDFLRAMMESPCFEAFAESLPVPGAGGTLQWMMTGQPEELRSRIRMKSGSMGGVRCYSGYIFPEDGNPDGIIIFSALVNNHTGSPSALQSFFEDLLIQICL